MRLTPAAANLLVEAIGRSENAARSARLVDLRIAVGADPKAFNEALRKLKG